MLVMIMRLLRRLLQQLLQLCNCRKICVPPLLHVLLLWLLHQLPLLVLLMKLAG